MVYMTSQASDQWKNLFPLKKKIKEIIWQTTPFSVKDFLFTMNVNTVEISNGIPNRCVAS